MTSRVGQSFACYQLLQQIGQGGMGEVWLASDRETGRRVAMKIPLDPEYIKFLRREVVMQAVLEHPNIISLLEIDLSHDPPFAVMEYFDSISLRQLLLEQGVLSNQRALSLFTQMLDGLEFSHAKGVLHLDLKPENLLINSKGHLKIADFGLGRIHEAFARSIILQGSLLSSAGTNIAGTYDYMSPEQRSGTASDPRVDIFALGIILCEMLTGARPAGNLRSRLERAGLEEPLVNLITTCLEEHEHRWCDVASIRGYLTTHRLLSSDPQSISPDAHSQQPLDALPRNTTAHTDLSALDELDASPQHRIGWWQRLMGK